MFPHLEPHGLIFKLNRAEQPALSAETVQRDQDFWQARTREMIGGWLRPETPLQTVLDFADKTYARKDLSGFTGNPRFVRDGGSQKMFSMLRCTIAGFYAWRVGALKEVPTPAEYLAPPGAERQRMAGAADLAFRQAFALCPYSPETVFRYSDFLLAQGRKKDAISMLETSSRMTGWMDPDSSGQIAKALADLQSQKSP